MEDIDSIDSDLTNQPKVELAKSEQKAPARLLSLRVQPGFKCFFRRQVEKQQIPISECFELVLKSHFNIEKLRLPISKILQNQQLTFEQKGLELLSRTNLSQRIYMQSKNDVLYKNSYCQTMQEKLKQLEMQVELYRRRSEQALEAKREQFKLIQRQQAQILRKALQEKQRRQIVIQEVEKSLKTSMV